MTRSQFSPIRMTAATEEAAVAQALQIVGATHDDISVEVLGQDAKGVTVRVSPRRDESVPAPQSQAAPMAQAAPIEKALAVEETSIDSEIEAGEAAEMALVVEDEASEEEAVTEIEDLNSMSASSSASLLASSQTQAAGDVSFAPRQTAPAWKLADEATQARVRDLAQDFLDRMGLSARVSTTDAPTNTGNTRERDREGRDERDVPRAFLQIEGEDVGILIGKHGQTLQSFQYLLNVTLNNQLSSELGRELGNGDGVRVFVDAGGYRAKRGESLQQMARDAASRAKRDRRSVRMEPMPAHERRLVHIALEGDSQITTSSEGREPLRHVVVIPAGAPRSSGGFGGGSGGRGGPSNRGGRGGFGGNGGFNRSGRSR